MINVKYKCQMEGRRKEAEVEYSGLGRKAVRERETSTQIRTHVANLQAFQLFHHRAQSTHAQPISESLRLCCRVRFFAKTRYATSGTVESILKCLPVGTLCEVRAEEVRFDARKRGLVDI